MGSLRHRVTVMWTSYAAGGLWIMGLILYGDVLWVAMMQELVPREVLGRVSSLVYLFAFSLGPLGILAGGVAASAIGVRKAVLFQGQSQV
jgi:hypothetical protein